MSDNALRLSEVSTWDNLVELLALMVPLSRQELAPLITSAKIPADLALVLDHTENVFDFLHPSFFCHATDTAVHLPEMSLADLSDCRFFFNKVNCVDGAGASVLADWCRRIPAIPCAISASALPEFRHKSSAVVLLDTKGSSSSGITLLFLNDAVKTEVVPQLFEVRSDDDDMALFRGLDRMHNTSLDMANRLQQIGFEAVRLKPSFCLNRNRLLNFLKFHKVSQIKSIVFLPDEEFDYANFRDGDLSLLQHVIAIALPSTCLQCPVHLLKKCPKADHVSITVGCDASISTQSWTNLPQVQSLEIVFSGTDYAHQELSFTSQIPLLLREMGHVKTLILSSRLPSVFAFRIDKDTAAACSSVTNVILNFPCTENHTQFFAAVFINAKQSRLLEASEPVLCNRLPAGCKLARVTIEHQKEGAVAPVPVNIDFRQCATIEVLGVDVSLAAVDFFIQKSVGCDLSRVRNVVFVHDDPSDILQLNDVRRHMIGACVHSVPFCRVRSASKEYADGGGGGREGGGHGSCEGGGGGHGSCEGGGGGGRGSCKGGVGGRGGKGEGNTSRIAADHYTERTDQSLSARVFFEDHDPSVYRLHTYETVSWEGELTFLESERHFYRCDLSKSPGPLSSKCSDVRCKVSLKHPRNAIPQLWVGNCLSIPCATQPETSFLERNDLLIYQLPQAAADAEISFMFCACPVVSIVATSLPDDIKRALDSVRVLTALGIESSDTASMKVRKICDYCRNFSEGSLPIEGVVESKYLSVLRIVDSSLRPALILFLRLFLSQAGVCRHRSQVATVLCHYVGIPAMYVTNDIHAFIEVILDGCLQSFDLGGGHASISYTLPDGSPYQPKTCIDKEGLGWSQTQGSNVRDAALFEVPSASAFVEAILKVVRIDIKNDFEAVAELLDMGSSLLVQTENCSRDSKLLLNCITAHCKDWVVLHIESLDAFQHAWHTTVFCEEAGKFKLQPRKERLCLMIDYVKMSQNHLVDLQANIDASLIQRNDSVCVIGLVNRAFADKRSEDFFSRWKKCIVLDCNLSSDEVCTIPSATPAVAAHRIIVDLRRSSRWECILFGKVILNGEKWILKSGLLQHVFEEYDSQPLWLHLLIQNPPTTIAAFTSAWEAILRNRGFTWYGYQYRIPEAFSWSFETTALTDVAFKVPQFQLPRGMAWFVSSSTVTLLQPFTNLLPNGSFAQHEGYLQQIIDSEGDVVFDSTLGPNELAHIIATDLEGKIPLHRLFVSDAFDDTSAITLHDHARDMSLTDHVQGRAIHFSLNERVVEALKRHLVGLQFEETEWLQDLEKETMAFTIVLPADHPDTPHVLNWIRYRQIWFPHRAVHIKARLRVMHTRRLGPRSGVNLSAISHDALDQLEAILLREQLLQLSGPPGCGKTTLASRFHREEEAKEEGGLVAETPHDDVDSNCSDRPPTLRFLPNELLDNAAGSSRQRLKRFSITTQINQLLLFLKANCDAVLVVEEFNLQNDGWWDNLLDIKAEDKRFFYKGTFYDLSNYRKSVLLIGNSAAQGGRVATAVETHCFLVECKAMNLQELVQKAMPSSMFDDANRDELQQWAYSLRENALFAQSSYGLTLRDLEAVVFEALHVGVSVEAAGRNLLGYYCGDTLPVQLGIRERVCSFLKPAEGKADAYLKCIPLAQRRKHGLFFVGESGVGKTTTCLNAIEELKHPFFNMSQSDDVLWAHVSDYLLKLQSVNLEEIKQLEKEMSHFGEHQRREKAVLVAAKCGVVLFIDELNTDRNLRLEETLNQVRIRHMN
jgi:uncharacterized membrane protein YgcG